MPHETLWEKTEVEITSEFEVKGPRNVYILFVFTILANMQFPLIPAIHLVTGDKRVACISPGDIYVSGAYMLVLQNPRLGFIQTMPRLSR